MGSVEKVRENIQLVRELSNELAAYLYTLPEEIWRNADDYASACEGWKIADVITHLIRGADMYTQSIKAAIRGDTSPPMGYRRPATPEEALSRLVELREAYYEDLFYEFNASCRRLNSLLVSLGPEDYDRPAWHPFSVITVARLIDYRVLELAVHGWDIRYPMDRSSTLSEKAVPFLTEWLWRWLRAGFQKGEPLESPVRYRFDLSEDSSAYDVVVTGDGFRLIPSEDEDADVTFRCDTNTYILFGMGRLPFRRSVRRGRLAFEGDEELASQFTDWFKGI